MNGESGLSIDQPVSIWKRPVNVNPRDLFKALGKAALDGALMKWDSLGGDLIEATAAMGLGTEPGQVAWLLIYRSIGQAMASVMDENKGLLVKQPPSIEALSNQISGQLEALDLVIDAKFFQAPKQFPLVMAMQPYFAQWLESFVGNPADARMMSMRLPTYFQEVVVKEWKKQPEKYACLAAEVDTPFTRATERERAWQRYRAWLQKQVEEPMFLEAFGLKQVYVLPNAYYRRKSDDQQAARQADYGRERSVKRIVVPLAATLQNWLERGDQKDAIRVICGGPGCGKSSFTKIWAAQLAESSLIPVLVIPLHQFECESDLVEAIGQFIHNDPYDLLPPNPLKGDNAEQRLLLIFDGLDELTMQGKVGNEAVQEFVDKVGKLLNRFNQQELRLQVLVSGRDFAIQADSSILREDQILHLLPYFMIERERKNYEDPQNLLATDLRNQWWQNYGVVSGRDYAEMPRELSQKSLSDITAQPLLNYLVALSYVRGELNISATSNLNEVYADLLKAIYDREWGSNKHPSLRRIEQDDFGYILEEIALASWHGDGRTTTVSMVKKYCADSCLKRLLSVFEEGTKTGVPSLLLAFYFRQSVDFSSDDRTFEFTHKSFGEYLTARRIVAGIVRIHEELETRKRTPDQGWDEKQALKYWAKLCGPSPMDEYLVTFLRNEVRLNDRALVCQWQKTLCRLIEVVLRQELPIEQLNLPTYYEASRQARNAEEILLAGVNACARVTGMLSQIEWPTPESFGSWLSHLRGQRLDQNQFSLCLNSLAYLNLQSCTLRCQDLDGANMDRVSLVKANLEGANMVKTSLVKANLEGASLVKARLDLARLDGANLTRTNLSHVCWDEHTRWRCARNLHKAINLPSALKGNHP
jgi:Pentapeptide repeats (8 copies)